MAMQRFTVRITHQPGRKLGLVLSDVPVESEECDYDYSDEEAYMIRGGGGDERRPCHVDHPAGENDWVAPAAHLPPSDIANGGSTLQGSVAAQAAATAEAMLGKPGSPLRVGSAAIAGAPKSDTEEETAAPLSGENGPVEEAKVRQLEEDVVMAEAVEIVPTNDAAVDEKEEEDVVMAELIEVAPAKEEAQGDETEEKIQAFLHGRTQAARTGKGEYKDCSSCYEFKQKVQYLTREWSNPSGICLACMGAHPSEKAKRMGQGATLQQQQKENEPNGSQVVTLDDESESAESGDGMAVLLGNNDLEHFVAETAATSADAKAAQSTVLQLDASDDDDGAVLHPPTKVERSLQLDFVAEAAAAAKAAKNRVGAAAKAVQRGVKSAVKAVQNRVPAKVVQKSVPPKPGVHKRKRPTTGPTKLCVGNSVVLLFAESIKALNDDGTNEVASVEKMLDPSNLKQVKPIKFKNGWVSVEKINTDTLAFALTGTIKQGDIFEKIQYTRISAMANASSKAKVKPASWKRRCRPYYRSDHFTTFLCENAKSAEVVKILTNPQHYPLYITFRHTADQKDGGPAREASPPRKRLKRSESCVNNQPKKDEVICLLDSSDEEEEDADGKVEQEKSPKASAETEGSALSPDPPKMSFYDDDFVLTPFGPGKILSSRVERHASSDKQLDGTIFKPTVVYSIDLNYGTCHVPASSVKPISGTEYTEKMLLTYQRVPINGHDLLRLRPMTYLNDSLINLYLKYLKSQLHPDNGNAKGSRGWDDLDGEGVHIFPSFCYTRIRNIMGPSGARNSAAVRSKIWKDLKSWTKGTDLFRKKLLVFPINGALHWSCVVVCHPGRLVRRYAKDLPGRKGDVITAESKAKVPAAPKPTTKTETGPKVGGSEMATGVASISSTSGTSSAENDTSSATPIPANPAARVGASNGNESLPAHTVTAAPGPSSNDAANRKNNTESQSLASKPETSAASDATTRDAAAATSSAFIVNSKESVPSDNNTKKDSTAAMESPANNPSDSKQVTAQTETPKPDISIDTTAKPGTKWQCDFCKKAKFDEFNDAVEHEKICDANVDARSCCMIHFDSGKHFKLHHTNEILGNIRKYLNAYYEAEYKDTHPGLPSFTMTNMPGFAASVPQQDNTKDCGVFMLENCERMFRHPPVVDNAFVKNKGVTRGNFFGPRVYDKQVIEKKRDDILQLIQTLRRGEEKIE